MPYLHEMGITISVKESVRRWAATHHPDEMRRGRKRHRKRAALRFIRRMGYEERCEALRTYALSLIEGHAR